MRWSSWKERAGRIVSWPQRTFWSSATVEKCAISLARWWRPRMTQALVIGVTGSAGKSTTRHVTEAILQRRLGPGVTTPTASTFAFAIAHAVLMPTLGRILRPDVAIITVARDDHASAFGSKADLFDEMEELLRHVPVQGTAILNADDPVVMRMRASCRGQALTYGLHPEADVRAEDVHAGWPGHLRLTIVYHGASEVVQTRMLSEHWVTALLAATACGLVAGMSLPEIAQVLQDVEPYEGRMQVARSRDGVVFIRDDYKAPQWTVPACFEFLRRVEGPRKVLVVGEISDTQGSKGVMLRRLTREALNVADLIVVVGPWSSAVLKLKQGAYAERVYSFSRTRDAAAFVNGWLRPGDLVMLKGSNKQNHLARILMDRDGEIHCWRDDCGFDRFCNVCDDRLRTVGPPAIAIQPMPAEPPSLAGGRGLDYLVLGLGNAERPRYENTPHNVGFALVDYLAAAYGAAWHTAAWGWHAELTLKGHRLCLVKLRSSMNEIGSKLMPVLASLDLPPERCVLAYDDLDTPLGKLRIRERGSAGGHRGVASILAAAQTDTFPRIKLGVRPAGANMSIMEYVLSPFLPEAMPAMHAMLSQGEERLLLLLQQLRSRPVALDRAAKMPGHVAQD
jgi:UDP-N-acetylmuramoyl-tripeptide--D-alanyl-D-alanine ligase